MAATRAPTTKIDQLLGIELPVIQSPMAGVQDAELAAAISNAGGLGSLPCAMLNPEALEAELTRLAAMTDKPFNLNFFCHEVAAVSPREQQDWQDSLAGYFMEFGVELPTVASGPSREPFGDAALSVIEPVRPAVVSFHFGLPERKYVDLIKSWGSLVIASATTVGEALWLAEHGANAIIAQGFEAGGHRGSFLTTDMTTQSGTFALVPQIADAVSVPVIAAGGIVNPESVAAAIALGAAGIQVGTAFLLCTEAKTSPLHRAALESASSQHTALTNVFTGRPARSIVNRLIREVGPMATTATAFPSAATLVTALRAAAEPSGISDFTSLWCGQNATGCREVAAAELLQSLVSSL